MKNSVVTTDNAARCAVGAAVVDVWEEGIVAGTGGIGLHLSQLVIGQRRRSRNPVGAMIPPARSHNTGVSWMVNDHLFSKAFFSNVTP